MKWSKEQLLAIEESNKSILVSAGAGSGKTAVLTQRLLKKIENGTKMEELIVLTFTVLAAKEMKERLRSALQQSDNPKCMEQLTFINNACIGTFDSYTNQLVKKYHYLLAIPRAFNIVSDNDFSLTSLEILNEIFKEQYEANDKNFISFITKFSVKDDDGIVNSCLNIYKNMRLNPDYMNILNNYESFYDSSYIDELLLQYDKLLIPYFLEIKTYLKELEHYTSDIKLKNHYDKLYEVLVEYLHYHTYDDFQTITAIKFPTLPSKVEDLEEKENYRQIYDELKKYVNTIKKKFIYTSSDELRASYLATKEDCMVIVSLIKELDYRLKQYKKKTCSYDFTDIALMAIKIIEEFDFVREEIRNKTCEILIDEYQDTSDIQERLINLICKDNVYMVGDIKQSIYRFRNANPLIFKEKYHTLQVTPPNMVIDLSQNFRSRKEVLDAVNLIFSALMGAEIGGVDYNYAHELHFGFSKYEDYNEENNQMQILTYPFERKPKTSVNNDDMSEDEDDENEEQTQTFTKDEIEAFIIGKDILSKVNKYKVYHKDIDTYGPATYKDFAILVMDKKKMRIYAKVFEYLGLPLKVHEDIILTNNNDIFAIISLLRLIYIFYNNKQASKQELKEVLLSFLRSFIVNLPDDEIFKIITDANVDEMFKKTLPDLYQKCQQIASQINELNLSNILTLIFKEFSVYEKMLTLSDVASSEYNLNYLFQICESLTSLNYSFKEMIDYLNLLVNDSKFEIKIPIPTSNNNDVINMMTIHASKGLEFPICYFPELYKKFNFEDLKRDIFYSKDYQIIASVLKDRLLYKPLTYFLEKENFLKAEVSEKIRLFYVALTRPREQIIMVMPTSESDKPKSTSDIAKMGIKTFKDMLLCLNDIIEPYKHPIDINSLGLTKEYLYPKKQQNLHLDNEQILSFCNITLKNHTTLSMRASASVVKYHTKEDLDKMNEGTRIHKILELLDLTNPDLEKLLPKDQKLIKGFINHPFIKSLNIINHYHEYHFITTQDEVQINGIIDLIIETEESYYIIDYKLYDTNKEEYTKQLNIYKNYLSNIVNKPVYSYLYSIIKNDFTKV